MIRYAVALLLLTLPLAAQELPDIAVTLTLDAASVLTGTRTGGTLTVRNQSAFESPQMVTASVSLQPRQQEITIAGPEGWSCGIASEGAEMQCRTESFGANAQAAFRFDFLTRNDLTSPTVRVTAAGYLSDQDPNPANNEREATLALVQHPATADLSVHATAQQNPVPRGTPAIVTLDVRNDGPAGANDVVVRLDGIGANIMSIVGAGWTCSDLRSCERTTLGAGQSAPITVTFQTLYDTVFGFRANVAAELSFDPDGSDNETQIYIGIGNAADWKRFLLPVVLQAMPGSYGSLWQTDITALIDSDVPIGMGPRSCDRLTCRIALPLRAPFRPSEYQIAVPGSRPATFIYVQTSQADLLKLNIRVRDLNRTAETWGTEVPAVRDEEFRTTPIVLMPLPVDPLFRTNLRVYDFDAREGAQVAIHVYADQETTPRTTLVRTFATWPGQVTTALLPSAPGYLQLDLGEAGAALAGAETAWIRVEPRTQGLRFWAFASVTNNPTGHVTTVTPQ